MKESPDAVVRYALCWEDADALLEGLAARPGDGVLSIASAGENALSLLAADPAVVVAVDRAPAQLRLVATKAAAYRALDAGDLRLLAGGGDGRTAVARRKDIMSALARDRVRTVPVPDIPDDPPVFWTPTRLARVARRGWAGLGRFDHYFTQFRRFLLPLAHRGRTVRALFEPRDREGRARFFHDRWNTRAWRALSGFFFSRPVMAALGRDPAFFAQLEGGLSGHVRRMVEKALVELDPSANPYLQWILLGRYATAWPHALRDENIALIRARLDRLRLRHADLDAVADESAAHGEAFDRMNLSDVFEYLPDAGAERLRTRLAAVTRPGGRLLYWNMAVPRHAPDDSPWLARRKAEADALHRRDKAFFYRRLVIEERRV